MKIKIKSAEELIYYIGQQEQEKALRPPLYRRELSLNMLKYHGQEYDDVVHEGAYYYVEGEYPDMRNKGGIYSPWHQDWIEEINETPLEILAKSPKNTLLRVSDMEINTDNMGVLAYFYRVTDGKVFCFANGRTSVTGTYTRHLEHWSIASDDVNNTLFK